MKREIDVGDDPVFCNQNCPAIFEKWSTRRDALATYCKVDNEYLGCRKPFEKTERCKKEAK